MNIDPDGRVVQEAYAAGIYTNKMLLTEVLDLDHASRIRKFGALGLVKH